MAHGPQRPAQPGKTIRRESPPFPKQSPPSPQDWGDVRSVPSRKRNRNGFDQSPDLRRELAQLMLKAVLPPSLRRVRDRSRPLVILFEAPSEEWVEELTGIARSLFPGAEALHCGAQRNRWNDVQEAVLVDELARGRPVIAITHDAAAQLSPIVLAAVDHHILVAEPDAGMIARLIRTFSRGRLKVALDRNIVTGLTQAQILSAFRRGEHARQTHDRLAQLRSATSQAGTKHPHNAGPRLEDLSGYGAATDWGLALAQDLVAFRRGELAWNEINSAALLHGQPGTGKTLFASALARSCDVPLISTSLGELFAKTSGTLDGVIKGMDRAFAEARQVAPAILFIDEIEAIPDRATMTSRAREWWTSVVTHFLKLLDDGREQVVVIGATNHFDQLDAAIIRPGRLEAHFEILPPDAGSLAKIMRHHLGTTLPKIDLEKLAQFALGATGAQVATWIKQARATARRQGRPLSADDLTRLVIPASTKSDADLWRIACHEAGHALVAHRLGHPIDQVSMVQRGESAGHTWVTPQDICMTRHNIETVATIALAGRAAEMLMVGDASAGAEGDLAKATSILAALHGSVGLGDHLTHRIASAEALQLLRDADLRECVENDLRKLHRSAWDLLQRERDMLEAVAKDLLHFRLLTGPQFRAIVEVGPLSPAWA